MSIEMKIGAATAYYGTTVIKTRCSYETVEDLEALMKEILSFDFPGWSIEFLGDHEFDLITEHSAEEMLHVIQFNLDL